MRTHIPLTVAGWLIGHATGIGWLSSEGERRLACQSEQLEEALATLSQEWTTNRRRCKAEPGQLGRVSSWQR